ncbi:MAG: hypothetical protein ACKOAU_09465 [Pirellula sp.]
MNDLRRAATWILWGLWWGGLSFYAIVVVPIGTEQIGSVAQGFITQRVTQWHEGHNDPANLSRRSSDCSPSFGAESA